MGRNLKLSIDQYCRIGMSVENIQNWAEYYLVIKDKISKEQELNSDEKCAVMRLLLNTAESMKAKPEQFLNSKPVGRSKSFTKERARKHIQILLQLGVASSLKEARNKTAEYLKICYDSVERYSRNLDVDERKKK